MSKPILYLVELSPPCRAVKMVAEQIGLELDVVNVDLFIGEHLKEPYLKLNPQHTVPTLVDEDQSIWDSHAICAYLVDKYASDDSLYPKDLVTRARVDQRLHFDSGVLFPALRGANIPIFTGAKEVPAENLEAISAAYDLLETFLAEDEYLVGNSVTIADLCAVATVTVMELHQPLSDEQHPKTREWIARLSELPYYEELITRITEKFAAFLDQKKAAAAE